MNSAVVLLGEPNVGKSSLLNAIIGENVSIVTNMSGTTRDQIRGFMQDGTAIIDTPGMHISSNNLGKHMRKSISAAVANATLVLYVLDATSFSDQDITKISNYRNKQPVIVAVNKSDKMDFKKLYPKLSKLNDLDFVKAIIPVSAKTGFNIDVLTKELLSYLDNKNGDIPVSTAVNFYTDSFTDQSVRQMTAEIIRAECIKALRGEIAYGVAVMITKFQEKSDFTEVHADIICEKPSHKPILIGRRGEMLKMIGTKSRVEIEKLLDCHIKLYTHVIVRKDWQNNKDILDQLGHNTL